MGFSNPVVGGEDLIRSAIRSPNFVSGGAGWRIAQDGSAEFNNVLVRGTLRTAAPPNKRIEIGTVGINTIAFYSGSASETNPATIASDYNFSRAFLDIISGGTTGDDRAYIQLNSAVTGGGGTGANITLKFTDNTVAAGRPGDFHCFLGAAGIARFYCTAERLLIDDFGILVTGSVDTVGGAITSGGNVTATYDLFAGGNAWLNQTFGYFARGYPDTNHGFDVPAVAPGWGTNFNVDGPVFRGWTNWLLATASNSHWQAAIGTNYVQVFGGLGVSNGSNNDVNIDPESITLAGGTVGVSMRQRTRASYDAARRIVLYPINDAFYVWQEGFGDLFRLAGNQNVHIPMGIPALGGGLTMCIVAASQQVGVVPSGAAYKDEIRDLDAGADNPLWRFKPRRFKWNEATLRNAEEANAKNPAGMAGMIAEEVYEVAPDAVVLDAEGKPAGFDTFALIAYLVDAVQHLAKGGKP